MERFGVILSLAQTSSVQGVRIFHQHQGMIDFYIILKADIAYCFHVPACNCLIK